MTRAEQKHTPGPLHISRQNDSTTNLLLKPIPGHVVCEIDPLPGAEANARLLAASYNAFDTAAKRLNLNAVELAERMQEAGIADLVDALKIALMNIGAAAIASGRLEKVKAERWWANADAVLGRVEGRT